MELEERLADRRTWSIGDACSMSKVLDLLNTKTAFVIVRECLLGTTRFEDFVERTGASAPAVSRALKQLESAQIVTRVPYREPGIRARSEYRLTEAGEELLPVFLSLVQWGDKYLHGGQAPLAFVDADTGESLEVRVTTATNNPPMRSDDVYVKRPTRVR